MMTIPLMILAGLSVLGGLLNLPGCYTFTNGWSIPLRGIHEGEFVALVACISTLLALLAIGLGWWLYNPRRYEAFWALPAAKRRMTRCGAISDRSSKC